MAAPRALLASASRSLATRSSRAAFPVRTTPSRQCRIAAAPIYRSTSLSQPRYYSSETSATPVEPPDYLDPNELKVFNMLKEGLKPTKLEVQDISGGCGSMYALDIVSSEFQGLPIVKQHRLVNKILGEEIKKWHGVQMKTKSP